MNYLFAILSAFLIFIQPAAQNHNAKGKTGSATIDERVKELLSKMTIEEKVGQMTQVTLQVVTKTMGTYSQRFEPDLNKLKEAIIKYHVGSLLNTYDIAMSAGQWDSLITKIQNIATKETRLKIPVLYGIDAIHGANYTTNATVFPQPISMAATWNRELVKKEGEITSFEVKACGIPWNFYPVLNLGRNPLWPRIWETYGEDVYMAKQMGISYMEGAQGNDPSAKNKLAVCLKHYAGYGFPLNGRDRTPAWIPERMMKEYFLPPFKAGIKAGALTVMVNSSEVNGIPTHSDYHLLTEVLKREYGFKGFVVSDWADIKNLYERDRVASSEKESVKMAVMAGVDMSMVPLDYSFYDSLIELVKEGSVPISRIDDAVSRILRVKFIVGIFDNPYPDTTMKSLIGSSESTKINLQAARESLVLVKNKSNILPLSKNIKLLVTGPAANKMSCLNGGWTITWQGDDEAAYPKNKNTVLKAIENKIGADNVKYIVGTTFSKDINSDSAFNDAKNFDAIIVVLGEKAYCETPGNIDDITLNEAQLNLASKLNKTGKPIILVMLEGRPRVISKIEPDAKAILLGFLPGMEGGNAVADILFGDTNPSGKLPITYPHDPNAFMHYDYKPMENFGTNAFNPQWNFGYGLSYTKFEYSNLTIDKTTINKEDSLHVSVTVKNTGILSGKEVVQLYISDLYGSVSRPNKQLKGFEKISLNPGESKIVRFIISQNDLSFIGRNNKRIVEPGDFKVIIDKLSEQFTLM
jgi:beta-glucosidase